jgi:hypothetical protein
MSASLPQKMAVGHHVLVFDVVSINLGNGYHPTTGVYMVPDTGVYVFTWSFRNHDGGYHSVELIKNTEVVAVLYSRAVAIAIDHHQVSRTAVVFTTKGDDIFVRTRASWSVGEISSDEEGRSYFAGWKLK